MDTRDGLSLTAEHIHKRLVGLVNLGLQPKLLIDGIVAKIVVNMAVRGDKVNGRKTIATNVVHDGIALAVIVSATVAYHALLALITDDVAVLLQHVAGKSLNFQHGRYIMFFSLNQSSLNQLDTGVTSARWR